MSRRRRQGLSPSLFPFLAVLVCTLGTLILFLALVAQNATEAAEQNSRAKQAKLRADELEPATPRPTADEVAALIAEEQFRIQQFLGIREGLTADIEDRRDQVTYLEDQIENVRKQLSRLNDQVENAMGPSTAEPIDQAEIEQLRARLEAERDVVEELRGRVESKTPRIVIVPHKGPNGTDRRAIYIECTSDGVTILPEGSRITSAQLEAAQSANPLDAALRVIRLHVMKHYGDSTPPYPLLVVRPDGIEAYGAARKAMRDWDDQFGYELVPAGIELAFTKPDVNLKQKVDLAIRSAASKQNQQHAIAGNRRFGGAGGRFPTLSAASLDRAGRASGFQSLKDSYSPSAHRSDRFPRNVSPQTQRTGNDLYQFGNRPSDHGALERASSGGDPKGEAMRSAAREMQAQAQASQQPGGGRGGAGGGGGTPYQMPTSDRSKRLTQQVNPYTTVPGGAGSDQSGATKDSNQPQPLRDPAPTSGSHQHDLNGESQQGPSSQQQNSSQPAGKSSSQRDGGNGGSSTTPAASMPAQMGQSRSTAVDQLTSPPQISNVNPASPQQVRRQGSKWALPPQMAGMRGNEIVRTLRLRCYHDRFELLSSSAAGGRQQMFPFADGDIDGAALQLATALRDRIERWGAALPGGRWQPRLEIDVMPSGEQSFLQLQTLMGGSGIEVTQRGAR
jgi:hypothetical protein